jgi:hypothetical protein
MHTPMRLLCLHPGTSQLQQQRGCKPATTGLGLLAEVSVKLAAGFGVILLLHHAALPTAVRHALYGELLHRELLWNRQHTCHTCAEYVSRLEARAFSTSSLCALIMLQMQMTVRQKSTATQMFMPAAAHTAVPTSVCFQCLSLQAHDGTDACTCCAALCSCFQLSLCG